MLYNNMKPVTRRMVVEGATDKYANEGERLYIHVYIYSWKNLNLC